MAYCEIVTSTSARLAWGALNSAVCSRWRTPNMGTNKRAQPAAADLDEIVTYATDLRNVGGPFTGTIRLTDTIPIGLEYIAGSLQVSPEAGTAVLDSRTLTWQGDMDGLAQVTISYQTRVVTAVSWS